MPHESRRAARAAAEEQARAATEEQAHSGRRKRAIWLIVAGVLVIALAAGAWLLFRVLTAKGELEAARDLVTSSSDEAPFEQRVSAIGDHAAKAAAASNDPVWRGAEWIPVIGDNLRAVRVASDGLDVLANDLGIPLLGAIGDDAAGSPLANALPVIEAASPDVSRVARDVAGAAESDGLIGPVRAAVDEIDGVLQGAAPALEVLPEMLGADGARNYLLVFQNNAESLPLGGSAASQTLISADGGNLAVVKQADSGDFTEGPPVDVAVDQSALDLYTYLTERVNTTTGRPDFPTAGQLLKAFWQRDIGDDRIDGVISIDPLALARVLKATGPITIGEVEITSKNAVSVLLRDAYEWWDPYASKAEAAASDAFFAGVAVTVFAKISGGDFDLKDMAWAVNESIDRGSIMFWSDVPEIAAAIDGQRVAGVLPTENDDQTTMGVYFRDTSASKIDYYMRTATALSRTCEAETSTFTARTTLHLDLTQDQADALPRYVKSRTWGSAQFRTEVFVYGPPGTSFVDATLDGRDVSVKSTDIDDLGRPVAAFATVLRPGESGTVTATFSGAGGFGPLTARTTPMINTTEVSIDDAC